MATNTPNLNLIKPGGDDPINVQDFNDNSDILDSVISNIQANTLAVATTAEATNGVSDNKIMTPLKTKQAIDNSNIIRIGSATGTNSLVLSATPLFDDLYTGLTIKFKNTTQNTGNVTVNVNSKGVKSVLDNEGNQLKPGALKGNSNYEITYDGVNFFLSKGGGGESPIKRVISGTLDIPANTDIIYFTNTDDPWVIANTIVKISLKNNGLNTTPNSTETGIEARVLTTTQVAFNRRNGGTTNVTINFEIIEFQGNVVIQRGRSIMNNNIDTLNVTISNVDLSKTLLFFSHETTVNAGFNGIPGARITSSTNLNLSRPDPRGITDISWFVVTLP